MAGVLLSIIILIFGPTSKKKVKFLRHKSHLYKEVFDLLSNFKIGLKVLPFRDKKYQIIPNFYFYIYWMKTIIQ